MHRLDAILQEIFNVEEVCARSFSGCHFTIPSLGNKPKSTVERGQTHERMMANLNR